MLPCFKNTKKGVIYENILNVPSPRIKAPEEAREFAQLILKCADLWEIELNKGEIA